MGDAFQTERRKYVIVIDRNGRESSFVYRTTPEDALEITTMIHRSNAGTIVRLLRSDGSLLCEIGKDRD